MARRNIARPIPFAPRGEALERIVAQIAEDGRDSGSAVDASKRRAAFARYRSLPIAGAPSLASWRHDYAKLDYDGLRWSSGRLALPNFRVPRVAAGNGEPEGDRPALATETSFGLVHAGSTYYYDPATQPPADRGVIVVPLADARRERAGLVPPLAAFDDLADDPFAQLAIAFQNCGAFVYVPKGVVLAHPIQLIFMNAGVDPNADAVFPHVVVVMGEGARATILERHLGEGQPFLCGIVAAHVKDGATLDYTIVQNAGEEARLFVHRTATCDARATIRWSDAELGGTLSRTILHAGLAGRGATAQTSALFFNTGLQHADVTAATDHRGEESTSSTVVRTAAGDLGQGRLYGKIAIAPGAHGADAALRGDALLLSKRAQIESIPVLEIATNEVRASHGATVGSLDREALFYVQSRGIARPDAVRMIALAFFEPAIARFPGEVLRDETRTALDRKIDEATELD